MTRREQLNKFNHDICILFAYAERHGIPIRAGEWYRSPQRAEANASMGIGIKNSKHIKSLALDVWIDPDGKHPVFHGDTRFKDAEKLYFQLGVFWESMGNKWGGRFKMPNGNYDVYHFEIAEDPAK